MKRFWFILLSLGLIAAFSTSAMAVDVKVSGEYYVGGLYLDNTTLVDDSGPSTAFFFQRLRLNTTFVVTPGLTLTTRADIMERIWGQRTTTTDPSLASTWTDPLSAGRGDENQNIAFDLVYLTYMSPIGAISAGYQIDGAWGTVFGDNSIPTGKVTYTFQNGSVKAGLQLAKSVDNSNTVVVSSDASDRDKTYYTAYGRYAWKDGEAGLLAKYIRDARERSRADADGPFQTDILALLPYVKAKLGPVTLQAEVDYFIGKAKNYDDDLSSAYDDDMDLEQMAAWVDAVADFGMVYVGGTLAYVSGDDPESEDDMEGGVASGGLDWNPCLIMFNNDRTYYLAGRLGGYDTTANGGPLSNAFFAQLRAGVKPIDKLDVMASFSWAKAERTLEREWESREYGYEIDLTATYKITNNLSYMLGAGYWFVGDYYYGTSDDDKNLDDNFMVINKLTLNF